MSLGGGTSLATKQRQRKGRPYRGRPVLNRWTFDYLTPYLIVSIGGSRLDPPVRAELAFFWTDIPKLVRCSSAVQLLDDLVAVHQYDNRGLNRTAIFPLS